MRNAGSLWIQRDGSCIESLEPRRLLATLVVDGTSDVDVCVFSVDANFIYANMNGVLIPQPVGLWDDVQINLFQGDDILQLDSTGDEPVDIFPGTGRDFVNVASLSFDLDDLSARVYMHAGTDSVDDLVNIFDDNDAGSDSYEIVEPASSPMRLRKHGLDKVWWGESNLQTSVSLNGADNTVTIDSTVNIAGTDENLIVGAVFGSSGGGNDTVSFTGAIAGDNTLRFEGGTGSDVFNVSGAVFGSGAAVIHMAGGNSAGDTLNITDPGTTNLYRFEHSGTEMIPFISGQGQGHFVYTGLETMSVDSTSATQVAEYRIQGLDSSLDLSINAGGGDDTFNVGDDINSLTTADFGTGVDMSFNGGAGTDEMNIRDGARTTAGTYEFGNNTFNHDAFGLIDYTSVSDATVKCGEGNDTISGAFGVGVATATVLGNVGADTFTITPDVSADWELSGFLPTSAPGDTLVVNSGALTDGEFTPNGVGGGTIDYPVRSPIVFTGMESFPQPGPAPGAADLAAASDSGFSSTDNITNLTSLTFTGSGAAANATARLYRDGTEVASTTATAGAAYTFSNVAFPTGDVTSAMTVRYISGVNNLLSPFSAPLNVRVDTIVPPTPIVAPDLDSASDTGISSTDNVTRDNTPLFNGTVPANDIVRLFASGVLVGSDTSTSAGTYSITSTLLSDGSRPMQAGFEDLAGNQSNLGTLLGVVIDTVAPASPTVAPDLVASSDTGVSNTDNITRDSTPTFTGTAPGNHVVRLLSSGVEVGFQQLPLIPPPYNVTSSTLADGNRVMTTRFEDIAGNTSPGVSPSLTVQIDTIAPTLTAPAAFNFLISQNLTFQFSENVGQTLSVADLALLNLTNSTSVPSASIALNFVPNTATFTFPGFANGILPDADYRARMTGDDLTDVAGNQFVGVQFDFFFLNGDANRDRRVNLVDFNIVAANFGGTNKNFGQGDFNYDRLVNLADFNVLASRFGAVLAPAATGPSFGNQGFSDETIEEELL